MDRSGEGRAKTKTTKNKKQQKRDNLKTDLSVSTAALP